MIQPIAIIEPFSLIRAIVLFCSGPQLVSLPIHLLPAFIYFSDCNNETKSTVYREQRGAKSKEWKNYLSVSFSTEFLPNFSTKHLKRKIIKRVFLFSTNSVLKMISIAK